MRAVLAVVVLSVATFHFALSASVEGGGKEEKAVHDDGLTKLLKVDEMEFEAAQKADAAQLSEPVQFEAAQKEDVLIVNVTVEDREETQIPREAVKDGCVEEQQGPADVNTGGDGHSEAAVSRDEIQSKSKVEKEEKAVTESSSSEEVAQGLTKK